MKYRKALYIAGGILLGVLLFGGLLMPGNGFGPAAQRMTSELDLKCLASSLIAYAQDHCENFPASFGELSGESFDQYGFEENLYARGDHIRLFTPADLDSSPLVREVFSHYSYIT